MTLITKAAVIGGVAALAVAGCGGSDDDGGKKSSSKSKSSASVAAPGAQVSVLSPEQGGSASNPVTVKVDLTGFKLDAKHVGMSSKPGHGHLHFSMDGGKYDYPKYSGPNGALAKKLGVTGKYSPSVAPTITYRGLPKGKHTLEVYLANNDHSNTGVEAKTKFSVR